MIICTVAPQPVRGGSPCPGVRPRARAQARTAEAEARALEAEDAACLTPRERAARRVARMILATTPNGQTPDPEAIDLHTIADACGVFSTTASAYRTEAAALLAGGYRPTA
ncbi:hypothetical protein [Kitasatospora sp. NPDC058218]|uniref:hypothetical protein n=1 Tax=Kitasatospora sp. NPDC058218 TaxID=3346385 RepID=UPI0036DB5055